MDGRQPESKEQLIQVVDKAVDIMSPLISVALAGVESGGKQFKDQKSLLDDLQNIQGWNRYSGDEVWVNIPYTLGYVYHSLHGSLSLSTNQLDLALSLARVKNPAVSRTKYLLEWERNKLIHVWESRELMGWSKSLSGRCTEGWGYLANAYERWKWLSPIFGAELEYRTTLVAYYLALSIHELAAIIASGQQNILKSASGFHLNVPLTFVSEGYDINERAILLLLRNPEALKNLWTSLNVTREQMEYVWRDWIHLSEVWLRGAYDPSFDPRVSHQHLFEVLSP